jgi:hypothetical protein
MLFAAEKLERPRSPTDKGSQARQDPVAGPGFEVEFWCLVGGARSGYGVVEAGCNASGTLPGTRRTD